ncbi:hypothetical protein XFF6166_10028 [Xanthomonas citri pv. fuscans]|nr:hypothetical protein XFF6166_10028 [Xanthomonas citri pv. fuscans]SOO06622.1 hypothetical protein XFF7767_80030 [Xanthomonas citri pv. fuscans]SOO16177.1 hypothetical protein XFF7766_770029 [Xanthomonas citri pv. fuscans]
MRELPLRILKVMWGVRVSGGGRRCLLVPASRVGAGRLVGCPRRKAMTAGAMRGAALSQ